MPMIGTASANRSTVLGRSMPSPAGGRRRGGQHSPTLRAVLAKNTRPGRENAIPAEQENAVEGNSRIGWRLSLRSISWRGTQSCVFFTPYAPLVRTPVAPASTNSLIEHTKTTPKAVYRMITAVQTAARKIVTNRGVTISLIGIRRV
jgi:hypothetical protein